MRRFLYLLVALSLSLVFAQPFPTLNGVVATDSDLLDTAAIGRAAQALQAEGAEVLVLFVESPVGSSLSEAESYLERALQFYGLSDNGYAPTLVALFVGLTPLPESGDQRPLYIVYGDNYVERLEAPRGGSTVVEDLQSAVMIPRLLEGDYTGAITMALSELTDELSAALTSTQLAPESVPVESEPRSLEPAPRLNRGVWLLTALFGVLFFIYLTRRVSRPRPGGADARLQTLKSKLSERIIDLAGSEARPGHDPFLPADPNAQTDMVLLTGLLQDERPDELAALQAEYREASEQLEEASKAFGALRAEEERLSRRSPELESFVARYEALLEDLQGVTVFTERLAGQWQALQTLTANLPQRLKKLRAALTGARTGVRDRLLGQTASFTDLFENLEARLEAAVSSYQEDHWLRALREVEELEADLTALTNATARLARLEGVLGSFTERLDTWQNEGAPPDFAKRSVQEVKASADVALKLLEQGDLKVVDAQLDEVEERLTAARDDAENRLSLLKDNARRLAELEEIGEETKLHIERAALSFDLVDDFAPANWRDIRGNGTEAQKAADAAFRFWQQAQQLNSLERNASVTQAAQTLDAAEAELRRAYTLTEAVETRLENLRVAQETAQQQLDELAQEIASQQEALRQPELQRDVGGAPRKTLQKAETLLGEVRTLLNEAQPDWLSALAKIQEADGLAELALKTVKEESAAMTQRRRILASEKVEAESSVKRAVQFVRSHKADMNVASLDKVQRAVDTYRHAQELEANAQSSSGDALATTLKEATIVYDEAQRLGDNAFALLETDFKDAETLRQQTAEAVAQTRADFKNLERFVRSSGLTTRLIASLRALETELPRFDPSQSPERLREILAQATTLEAEIERLHNDARRHAQAVQSAQRQERLRQLERARRQRAAEDARQRSTWGAWPDAGPPVVTLPRRDSSVRNAPRPMPRASSAPPIKLPTRSSSTGGRSGGGWGGGGRKSGGGW